MDDGIVRPLWSMVCGPRNCWTGHQGHANTSPTGPFQTFPDRDQPALTHTRRISVIGLGYVGLPVAAAFGQASGPVMAFDTDRARIAELRDGFDRTNEVDAATLVAANLVLTDDDSDLSVADFHIVTVPTPVDADNRPDLSPLRSACRMVGRVLKKGDIVVFESTVYPGATLEVCRPILEQVSELRLGSDFALGYSPERINPGDPEHRFETITKVVSASDDDALATVAEVYGSVVRAGVHKAPSIPVAEAAKVIENTQRDLNVALMNELAIIFDRLGIDTRDVLDAAGTKWNFLKFRPGLVGGHCISVDPFYLTCRAQQVGVTPAVILAGRKTNDRMGLFIAEEVHRKVHARGARAQATVVSILGATFKENVPDIRNSRVVDICRALRDFGFDVQLHDPVADPSSVRREWGLTLQTADRLRRSDVVVLAVAHRVFVEQGWPMIADLLRAPDGLVMDIKGVLDRATRPAGVELWRL